MDVRGVAVPLGAAVLSVLLVGCGSGNDTISSSTADDLHRQVDAVREAVADGRHPAALTAVADLRKTIRRLAASGELNADDSEVLLTQADRIVADIKSLPTPTPRPTPTPLVVVELPLGEGKGEGKDKDKGKGKGDDEDEGDD